MRNRFRLATAAAVVSLIGAGACLDTTPPKVGTPIDCATLAMSLAASEPTLTTTASGLKFRDKTVGTGAVLASGHLAAVHYSGCLTSGVQFDNNLDSDNPFVFTIGDSLLIKGFSEGVTGMRVGGRREVVIPPSLGYKATGSGPIPGNATIVFTIDAVATQ